VAGRNDDASCTVADGVHAAGHPSWNYFTTIAGQLPRFGPMPPAILARTTTTIHRRQGVTHGVIT
jgi:hypothetical protein